MADAPRRRIPSKLVINGLFYTAQNVKVCVKSIGKLFSEALAVIKL
jgi:hypothetical protein